jgi:hypothetical protein
MRGNKETVADGLLELVGICGDSLLEIEELVGVLIDLLAWGGGEADEEGIEVTEDLAVALVD